MKKIKFFLTALLFTFGSASADWASIYHSIIAFDETGLPDGNRPGYVQPIITQLGTVLNGNWVHSADVPQSFSFDAGLPITLSPITDKDRKYTASNVPTIFGENLPTYDYNANIPCSTSPFCQEISGNETLNSLGLFSYPIAQAAVSYYHARVVLRGMWLPAISELKAFSLFGFGLQYSFGYLFQYALPKELQTLNVSLAFGYNSSSIGYTPEDYTGQLDLSVSSNIFQMVIGYSPLSFIEVMLSLGYETASMKSGGTLVSPTNQTILPTLSVDGTNGFRLGLEVSFTLGNSYHPVIGANFGTRTSFNTNILYFKQTFGTDPTPEEIAKKKKIKKETAEKENRPAMTEMDYSAFDNSTDSTKTDGN